MNYKIILILISLLYINNVQALSLDSASGYPYKSYACQPITIFGNFSGGIPNNVYANIDIGQTIFEHQVQISQSHNITLTTSGGGIWSGTWGNDANIHWGQRNIVYNSYTGATLEQFSASNVVFIMNSQCVGTGKTNYTQMAPSGLGNFSRMIWQNPNLNILDLGLYYWLSTWGYMFYVLVMFTIVMSIYMKTQNIYSGVFSALIMLMLAATSNIVPVEYRQWIVMLIGICLGVIYFKFFNKD